MEKIIFIVIVLVWALLFFRIPIIYWRTIMYIKTKYPQKWEDEIQNKIGTSIFGGQTIFDLVSDIEDDQIILYNKKRKRAVLQLVVGVVLTIAVFIFYALTR